MKKPPAGQGVAANDGTTPCVGKPAPGGSPARERTVSPGERWRRLATGLRGVNLFRVTLAVGRGVFWEAECTLNGSWVCRRFASELHARAWLSVASQPRIILSSVERRELDQPCRGSCLV